MLVAAPAFAAQIRVPADQPTLAAALAVAAPGDVILVQTAVNQGAVVITKPVTILGDPVLNIQAQGVGCIPVPLVQLNGPGSGTVTIADATVSSNFDCANPPTPIGGIGFAALHLYSVTIPEPLSGASGYGKGVEGVRTVGIPFVAIERSSIRSAQNDTDDCLPFAPNGGLGLDNYAAVDVGAATLVALDSELRGGNGGYLCSMFGLGCPLNVATKGGEGASAVKAGVFHSANSVVAAGAPSQYLAWSGSAGSGTPTICHTYTSYPAVIAPVQSPLPGWANSTVRAKLGQNWSLSIGASGGPVYGFVSFGWGTPITLPGLGTVFLQPGAFFGLGLWSNGTPTLVSYAIPNDSTLLGVELCVQGYHATQGLWRPVADVIGN
ncbi:MAG: hypothetical protein EPO68_05655 [Planctomycetota bacterium]|nr:MAG: hypothetical protein EPO68_05655 [Planctomycetota bacterium]